MALDHLFASLLDAWNLSLWLKLFARLIHIKRKIGHGYKTQMDHNGV
jgi:hypothetical protein